LVLAYLMLRKWVKMKIIKHSTLFQIDSTLLYIANLLCD
jgi:hypothetical protein